MDQVFVVVRTYQPLDSPSDSWIVGPWHETVEDAARVLLYRYGALTHSSRWTSDDVAVLRGSTLTIQWHSGEVDTYRINTLTPLE